MASGVVKIEGKEISLDQQIIDAGIPAIKAALSVDFADVENADIEIVTPGGGAPKVATVVKRGTGKGNQPGHPRGWQSATQRADPRDVTVRFESREYAEAFLRGIQPDSDSKTIEIAKDAIVHVLKRIKDPADDARKTLGPGTKSFEKLTAAAAALFNEPPERVREFYSRSYGQ